MHCYMGNENTQIPKIAQMRDLESRSWPDVQLHEHDKTENKNSAPIYTVQGMV